MKRTPLTRHTPLRFRSATRAAQMRVYVPRAAEFLAANPWCQFPPDCGQPSTVVHHKRGRSGARLLDQRWWAASCDFHNDFAETRTGEALSLGWLIRIEGVA